MNFCPGELFLKLLARIGEWHQNLSEKTEYCTKDQSNVKDVEDRSNTPKGCNAMYVGDVEDGKRIYTHILAHNFLNT